MKIQKHTKNNAIQQVNNLSICDIKKSNCNISNIIDFINILDKEFIPSLSSRTNVEIWSKKLYEKSYILVATEPNNKKIIALLCFYCDDYKSKYSYIPMLGVLKEYRNQGLIKMMFVKCFKILKKIKFKTLGIETWSNSVASKVYESLGFKEISRRQDRPDNTFTIYYEKKL